MSVQYGCGGATYPESAGFVGLSPQLLVFGARLVQVALHDVAARPQLLPGRLQLRHGHGSRAGSAEQPKWQAGPGWLTSQG